MSRAGTKEVLKIARKRVGKILTWNFLGQAHTHYLDSFAHSATHIRTHAHTHTHTHNTTFFFLLFSRLGR